LPYKEKTRSLASGSLRFAPRWEGKMQLPWVKHRQKGEPVMLNWLAPKVQMEDQEPLVALGATVGVSLGTGVAEGVPGPGVGEAVALGIGVTRFTRITSTWPT
jgi:hypothetical protein